MINNHKGEWFKIIDGKRVHQNRCLCCNKSHAELKQDFKRFSELRRDLEHDSKTRTMVLTGFSDYIGTENIGSHYWYTWHGDPCMQKAQLIQKVIGHSCHLMMMKTLLSGQRTLLLKGIFA